MLLNNFSFQVGRRPSWCDHQRVGLQPRRAWIRPLLSTWIRVVEEYVVHDAGCAFVVGLAHQSTPLVSMLPSMLRISAAALPPPRDLLHALAAGQHLCSSRFRSFSAAVRLDAVERGHAHHLVALALGEVLEHAAAAWSNSGAPGSPLATICGCSFSSSSSATELGPSIMALFDAGDVAALQDTVDQQVGLVVAERRRSTDLRTYSSVSVTRYCSAGRPLRRTCRAPPRRGRAGRLHPGRWSRPSFCTSFGASA